MAALLAAFAAPPVFAADSFKIVWYGDDSSINTDLLTEGSIEKSSGTIRVDNREIVPAYVKPGGYVINVPANLPLRVLREAAHNAIFYSTAAIIEAPGSVGFSRDDSVLHAIPGYYSSVSDHYIPVSSETVRLGMIDLPGSGAAEIITGDGYDPDTPWHLSVAHKIHLSLKGRRAALTVFGKVYGGLGNWNAALDAAGPSSGTVRLSTGYTGRYEDVLASTSALADYYAYAKPDIVAFMPEDIPVLSRLLRSATAQADMPQFIAANLYAAITEDVPFKKYAVVTRGGAKLGFFSLLPSTLLSGSTSNSGICAAQDYVAAAAEAVAALRRVEHVDFVIFVSSLEPEDSVRVTEKVAGIDIVIPAKDGHSRARRAVFVSFADWLGERRERPFYIAERRSVSAPGLIEVTYERKGGVAAPLSVKEDASVLAQTPTRENPYEEWNQKLLSALLFSGKEYLLPSARDLWPENYSKSGYGEFDIYSLAAGIIRGNASAEVSFLRIRRPHVQISGAVAASVLKDWLSPDQKIVIGRMYGRDIKSLMHKVDFSSGTVSYDSEYRLAASGISADGFINGIAINSSERYKVALPEGLLGDAAMIPEIKNIEGLEPAGYSLFDAVSSRLSRLRDEAGAQADKTYSDVVREAAGIARGNPPAAADANALALVRAGDYAGLYSFAEERAQKEYKSKLRAAIENKPPVKTVWRLNLRDISLQFADTQVENAQFYSGFSNAQLASQSQVLTQGSLKFYSELYHGKMILTNGLALDYGRVTLQPLNQDSIINETVDTILFENEYLYGGYHFTRPFGPMVLGPFANVAYDTEFTPQPASPKRKIVRGKGGIKLFEGSVLKEFYLAGVTERDYTYTDNYKTHYAWETGAAFKLDLWKGHTVLAGSGYFRNFARTESDGPTDLLTELKLDLKLNAALGPTMTIGPYLSFYRVEGKFTSFPATNILIGVTLNYSRLFKPLLNKTNYCP